MGDRAEFFTERLAVPRWQYWLLTTAVVLGAFETVLEWVT